MLIVMHRDASKEQIETVCKEITDLGLTVLPISGAQRTAIAVTGNKERVQASRITSMSGVLEIIHVTKPFKLASREMKEDDTVIPIGGVTVGGEKVAVIAGPCAVESRDQVLVAAHAAKQTGATLFRGGAFKPRTSPYAFQGMREQGLKILAEAREQTGLAIVSEVMDKDFFDMVEDYVDVIQIGARNMQNYPLLYRAGESKKPILLKRGMSATITEWLLAAEYIMSQGNFNVILCERGIRTFSDHSRFTLDFGCIPYLKSLTHLPLIVDPSHAAGRRSLVAPLARAAVAAGADGVMVEIHPEPEKALCDGPQALTLEGFEEMMLQLETISHAIGRGVVHGGDESSTAPEERPVVSQMKEIELTEEELHTPQWPTAPVESIRVVVPSSKSLTQRALILAALADGRSTLKAPLECDDSMHLRSALRALGVEVHEVAEAEWLVDGGQLCTPSGTLWCGNAGTALRFLSAFSLLLNGELILDGNRHMRRRPVQDIATSLAGVGVTSRYLDTEGFPPFALHRQGELPERIVVDPSKTSQFVSGLLMAGRCFPRGVHIELEGPPVSRPYLHLTLEIMKRFGAIDVEHNDVEFYVPPGGYEAQDYDVEGDWSAAAMVLVASWISRKPVSIPNVKAATAQGDRVIIPMLNELERPRPHRFDLSDCPDLITPLATAAVFANDPTEIIGVAHARVKECDRIYALASELARLGVTIKERHGGLVIQPCSRLTAARLNPFDDHRMAMAFGLLSLRQPGIEVLNKNCVSKSFPDFWHVLRLFK